MRNRWRLLALGAGLGVCIALAARWFGADGGPVAPCGETLPAAIANAPDDRLARPRETWESASRELAEYRAELARFRREFASSDRVPDVPFFLFGMGARPKFIYRNGQLIHAPDGRVVCAWRAREAIILPSEYRVVLRTASGNLVSIEEDAGGIRIEEGERRSVLVQDEHGPQLPDFAGHRYPRVLRVLHQELLVNVRDGQPVPNLLVYPRPWYRDGAMMALGLRETGNLGLLRDWILGLREPYDRNAGEPESDNLGQALFLLSLVSDRTHPLVQAVLAEIASHEVRSAAGTFLGGRTDGQEHPVYQTKWLKYGLHALGLPGDGYSIPRVADSYSALFWPGYRDEHVAGGDHDDRTDYPYLGWACDHFHGEKHGPVSSRDYPLTWEANASQADYGAMKLVDPVFTRQRIAAPHTWHAAEIFLYLLDLDRQGPDSASVR